MDCSPKKQTQVVPPKFLSFSREATIQITENRLRFHCNGLRAKKKKKKDICHLTIANISKRGEYNIKLSFYTNHPLYFF